MTFTHKTSLLSASFLAALLLFGLAPQGASAAVSPNAFLGGGNALSRATLGQSQGLTNANPASDLLARLTFAGTHGGRAEEVPPENGGQSNSGGNSANGETGTDGDAGAQDVIAPSPSGNENGNNPIGNSASSNGASNGGATAGNGGDGGDGGSASPGGLVRAGNVVSNATAVNMINVNIVRISLR